MPLTPDEFHSNALAAADAEGRLPLSRMAYWDVFPFDPDGLRVVPLQDPVLPEQSREGEDPSDCLGCRNAHDLRRSIWRDEHWRLTRVEGAGAPVLLMVSPLEHHDLPDLPDERAAELGVLLAHLARAVESLPHIARAHVSRWGDGGAHLHVFVIARPEGFAQLRGTCMALWDDLLPEYPNDVAAADAATVARALAASYGGTAVA